MKALPKKNSLNMKIKMSSERKALNPKCDAEVCIFPNAQRKIRVSLNVSVVTHFVSFGRY